MLNATAAFVTLTFTASARPASSFVLLAAQFGQWKIKRETILARNGVREELDWVSLLETIASGLRDDLSSLFRIGLVSQWCGRFLWVSQDNSQDKMRSTYF